MAFRDSGRLYSSSLPSGIAVFSSSSSATEVSVDIFHEFLHGLAAVVAGHVVVEVLPQSLDTIVIRAVRRQEVELYLPLPSGQCQLDLTAVMNLEVVEDDVDPASVWVGHRHQPMDQEEEQCAVLAFPLDPGELARAGIERAGQVTLLVLAGRRHGLLLARQHPVRSYLGVQMDVYLILVHGDLARCQGPDEPSNLRQPSHFAGLGPRATHGRFRSAQTHTEPLEQSAHRGHAHTDPGPRREHEDQEFLSPCRPQVTVVPGRAGHDGHQLQLVSLGDLVLAVVLALVSQPRESLADEAIRYPIHLRRRAQAACGDGRRRLTLDQSQNDFTATAQDGVWRSPAQGPQNWPLSPLESSPNAEDFCTKTHEELPSLVCRAARRVCRAARRVCRAARRVCRAARRKCLVSLIFLTLPESRKAI